MNSTPTLFTSESGSSGPTLVFLPGLGGTTRYWQGRVDALERDYRLRFVDLLGFGQSPKPWTQYTVEQHVSALHHTINQQAPFTLVGHSMGAILAIAYAARYPKEVERLVLFSLPYYGGRGQAYQYFHNGPLLERYLFSNIALATIACVTTRKVFGWFLPYLLPNMPREIVEDLLRHTWRSFTSSLWEVIYNYDLTIDAERLDKKISVLCIHGDDDQTAPLAGVRQLAVGRPNWTLQVLNGVDHHPLLHVPEISRQAIERGLLQKTGRVPSLHKRLRPQLAPAMPVGGFHEHMAPGT